MRARPLFSRLFGWFLVLLVLVVLVIAASLALGSRASLRRWDARLSSRIEARVEEELEQLVAQRPAPTPLDVERALRGLLSPGVAVRVYDPRGTLLFAFQRGQPVMVPQLTPRGPSDRRGPDGQAPMGRMNALPPDAPPVALPPAVLDRFRRVQRSRAVEPSLYFRASSEGFLTDEPNRILFASIVRALVIGLAAAVALASGGAWLVTRSLARSTRRIADVLSDIAAGARDRTIKRSGVHELNRIAETAERLQNDLADQERIRTQWAEDVAHDLRTPVAAVIAQLEAVRDGVLPAHSARYGRMIGQIRRISSLVEQLNLLTRLESPERNLHCEPVAVGEAAAVIAEAVEGQLPEGEGHEVTAAPADRSQRDTPTSGATIELDLDLILRAVANVVDNALRYRTPGTRVTVRVEQVGAGLRATVRNEGTLPGRSERLFDRLVRGEAERSSEGTGLGLSIARAVATRHGGAVTLRTASGGVVEATIDLLGCVSNDR